MLKNKSGILYSGDFEGKYLRYIDSFSNKKQLEKLVLNFIKDKKIDKKYLRYIDWEGAEDGVSNVDLTIDYGNHSNFLLVIFDED